MLRAAWNWLKAHKWARWVLPIPLVLGLLALLRACWPGRRDRMATRSPALPARSEGQREEARERILDHRAAALAENEGVGEKMRADLHKKFGGK